MDVGPYAEAMRVELSRFRVKPNCSGLVEDWIAFLNDNMREVLVTLEGERMYVESIFTECIDKAYPAVDLPSRVTMIPERIRQLMR